MFKYAKVIITLACAVAAAVSTNANAQVAVDGGSGLFNVQKARTLGDIHFGVGAFYDTSNHDSAGVASKGEELDMASVPLSFTIGFKDNLEFSAAVPFVRAEAKNGGSSESGLGDGIVRIKWNFFNSQNLGFRLGGIVSTTLATGDKDKGLGTGKSDPAFTLALDKEYEMVTWHANLGYVSRQEEGLANQTTYGAGVEYMPIKDLSFLAEANAYSWASQVAGRDDSSKYMVGARYYMGDWGSLTAGYGSWTGGSGSNSPNYMWMAGVTMGLGLGQPRGVLNVPKAEAAPVEVKKEEPEVTEAPKITLEGVHYKFDKSDLTPEAQNILKANAEKLKANPGASFVIEGHTCSIGTQGYNQKLGLRRAISAKKFLIEQGINADRIEVISYGEDKPAHSNKTREGRKLNRRADFVIKVK
ncbi:MAG: OmpA family protein [Nitrospinae bacterium]|nr:OmpA family protein [Nitrospinota bacterium]